MELEDSLCKLPQPLSLPQGVTQHALSPSHQTAACMCDVTTQGSPLQTHGTSIILNTQGIIAWGWSHRQPQFSRLVMSDSLQLHESQHARPPCPSPTPGVHSNFTSIESVMPSSHLILCCPLLLLPSIPPSISESTLLMRWPKY